VLGQALAALGIADRVAIDETADAEARVGEQQRLPTSRASAMFPAAARLPASVRVFAVYWAFSSRALRPHRAASS
jgi:hypothetical protein